VYTGRTTNWPAVVLSIVLGVVVIATNGTGPDGGSSSSTVTASITIAVMALVAVVNVLTASSVRASAGPNGFDIRWGLIGYPRNTYALHEIVRAEVVDVPWFRVTYGWWWTPKSTTCTVRSGPAVRLHLENGRRITATVPDPAAAVEALHDARAT